MAVSKSSQGIGPIWEARHILNVSQAGLAEMMGCSVDSIRRCERTGGTFVNRHLVKKLQNLLSGHMEAMTGQDSMRPKVIHTSMAVDGNAIVTTIVYSDGDVYQKFSANGTWQKLELPK